MIEALLELGGLVAEYSILLFVIGLISVKFIFWGGVGTLMFWSVAPLVESFSRGDVIAMMMPHIRGLVWFYPNSVVDAVWAGFSTEVGGVLGVIGAVVIIILGIAPYLVGVYFSVTRWPELLLLRAVV